MLKLGQNVLLSKCYKLVLVCRNAFFGDNTVALGQSVYISVDHYSRGSSSEEETRQRRQRKRTKIDKVGHLGH